jgi:LmbE family N-acetylglucosaminyl deacetylase/glycosyltransferase involved in cell wall biosynthesis
LAATKGGALNPGRINSVSELAVEGSADGEIEVMEGPVVIATLSPRGETFRFQLPARFRDGAEHYLHFRERETSRRLLGSPVVVRAKGESAQIPFHTSDFRGKRVLVLAPHPDDESLGCGGALILHRDAGDDVSVIFLTDGSAGGEAERRLREAQTACTALGVKEFRFWGKQDRQLKPDDETVELLSAAIEELKPELVYCTSPWEYHPDHQAAYHLLARALGQVELELEVLLYELGRPLPVNVLIDISPVNEQLQSIYREYHSQLARLPYDIIAESLKRYRSHTVADKGITHCEGFYQVCSRQMTGAAPLPLPIGPARLTAAPEPELVSIVVRTQRRPHLLTQALKSLAAQTYRNLEVVVVNDGGPDVQASLEPWRDCFLNLRYLRLDSSVGRSEAGNRGVEESAGGLIGFLDDDDLLFPEHVGKLAGFLSHTGESFAYSDCERTDFRWAQDRFVEDRHTAVFHSRDFDRDELYFENFIPNMVAMFRRDLWEKAGPLDPAIEVLEDWELWLRMSRHSHLCHLPGVTSHYRVFGPRDYDYSGATLRVYRKHEEYWNLENLARVTWPGIRAVRAAHQSLEEDYHKLKGHAHCLEQELKLYRRPLIQRVRDRILGWVRNR